ncbi:arylsulfotransferase family protein [Rhodococcus artemisiae]|uniref:Arylsulfotransferase family protein n=1 Tax=Rhodococcus artemisiae TaxID=714159 RepID=A0ABU7LDE6_9NOCA|nr:arylsulfotransferase family protein [Rhodococcus artemisiae]MEE2059553.1 arylsulfotransferase family protein [Rhodococcus artemisiae]
MRKAARWAIPVSTCLILASCTADNGSPPGPVEDRLQDQASQYLSRPDLAPPIVDVLTTPTDSDGLVFLTPRIHDQGEDGPDTGLLIVDRAGNPLWAMPHEDPNGDTYVNDIDVQTYRGEPVLTFWEGTSPGIGWGEGTYRILDSSYRHIASVGAGNGYAADFHDLVITPRDTALLTSYARERRGRPFLSAIVQEIDISTGAVLFEWNSLDHIDPSESMVPEPDDPEEHYDYFHINSVDEDIDGNLLLSARHTHALYKIDRDTGDVLWRLGGPHSDFALDDDSRFAWQHDARWLPDGRISLLDNVSDDENAGRPSRALILELDEQNRSARTIRAFENPDPVTSATQANHQVLPNGHSFVGWGSVPTATEFGADGSVLWHASLPEGMYSYRAHLFDWTATPAEPPSVVAHRDDSTESGPIEVAMSWNGATEVAAWRISSGPESDGPTRVTDVAATGFETVATIPGDSDSTDSASPTFVTVEALDEAGVALGASETVEALDAR